MAVYIDFDSELTLNWDPAMHRTGSPMPANAEIWGLKILDWDNAFTERMEQFTEADLRIPFQYLEQIPNWDKGANWNDVGDVMGRFESMAVYSNSGAQELSLTLIFHAEALRNGVGVRTHWTLENIEMYTKRLQSLVFPGYDGKFSPPNKVLLNIGNIWRNVPLIVKNVSVEHQAPFHWETGLPMMRKITVQCRTSYPLWQGIGNMSVYTAWDEARGVGERVGSEVFAFEALDDTWSPGRNSSNPFDSAFVNYGG